MGIKIFCLSLLIYLFMAEVRGYAREDVGPDLFREDYGYQVSGYWDHNDRSELVLKSCRAAQRPDCAKAIQPDECVADFPAKHVRQAFTPKHSVP